MLRNRLTLGICVLAASAFACSNDVAPVRKGKTPRKVATVAASQAAPDINPRLLRRFKPARTVIDSDENPLTKAKVELGRQLFHDPRLSGRKQSSCNSCHRLTEYGVDGQKLSLGGKRNVPTVYHTAGQFEFDDGKSKTIEQQAAHALLSPTQSGAPTEAYVVDELEASPAYVAAFKAAFPDDAKALTFENVSRAIGAFERHLTTRSRWDAFLEGDLQSLKNEEAEGLKVFLNVGCAVCHTGEDLGGTMYEKLGAVERWPNQDDQGRYETTKKDADRMQFKVPTLRNVAETAPYFHDGGTSDLTTAVTLMARHQIGMKLDPADAELIVAWLKTLTGQLPDLSGAPSLPPSRVTLSADNPIP